MIWNYKAWKYLPRIVWSFFAWSFVGIVTLIVGINTLVFVDLLLGTGLVLIGLLMAYRVRRILFNDNFLPAVQDARDRFEAAENAR
jgi:hypothetical protein